MHKITKEMELYFLKRTYNHIHMVRCEMIKLMEHNLYPNLESRLASHDKSKFLDPEYKPYVILTWQYKNGWKDVLPKETEDAIREATIYHITTNSHHPEYHAPEVFLAIHRDGIPHEIVNASEMPLIDIAEMVCDWVAMGKERGNTAKSWADKTVNKRWQFNDRQVDEIYRLIGILEDENN